MTNSAQISFGIIGCGHIAGRHASHLAELEGAALQYCYDTDTVRLHEFSQKHGLYAANSLEDFLKHPMDVVIIATPNASHCAIAQECIQASKHVLIEKPLDIDSKVAEALITRAAELNRKVFVVKQNRYNPPIARIKHLLNQGLLGKIHHVSIHGYWNRNATYYQGSQWRGTKAQDGGILFTQFSHFIDILYYLFGELAEVNGFAVKCRDANYLEFEDNTAFSFKLKSGVIGSMSFSTTCVNQNMEGSLTLIAEHASIKVGGKYLNTLEYISGLESHFDDLEQSRPANDYGHYEGSMSNHDKVLRNLMHHLQGKEEMMTSGEEGLQVVKMIEQFYNSVVVKS